MAVRLCIPASDKTLPPPLDDSQTTFLLPLADVAQDDDDDDEELAKAPPRLLSLLVSALQISLEASYVAPRLRTLSSSTTPGQADASTSSNYLIPATLERDAAYQNVPLQRNSNNGEVTPMFAASWNGSKVPKEAGEGDTGRADAQEEKEARNGGEMWYRQEKGQGEWVTEWRCKMPISECAGQRRARPCGTHCPSPSQHLYAPGIPHLLCCSLLPWHCDCSHPISLVWRLHWCPALLRQRQSLSTCTTSSTRFQRDHPIQTSHLQSGQLAPMQVWQSCRWASCPVQFLEASW